MPESEPVQLPRFNVPGKTPVFDLLDELPERRTVKTPLWDVFDGILGPLLRRYGFRNAVRQQVNALVPMMAERVGTARAGYLLRLNVYADEHGNTYFPGGEIVSALGVGIEPLDALAESYRLGGIQVPRPRNLDDQSSYCWMVREGSRFTCTHIPAELARGIEARAKTEADRRNILGGFVRENEGRIDQISAAQYWGEVVQARILELENLGIREKIEALQTRMNEEQDRFNRAYGSFQRTTEAMADEAKEQRFLDAVGTVLSVISTGIAVRDSANSPSRTAKPPMSQENARVWRASRERVYRDHYERLTIEVNQSADSLEIIQNSVRTEFESRNIPLPANARIPRIVRP